MQDNNEERQNDYIDYKIRLLGLFAALVVALVPFATVNIAGFGGLLLFISLPLLFLSFMVIGKNDFIITINKETVLILSIFAYGFISLIWSPNKTTDFIYTYLKVFIIVACISFNIFTLREQRLIILGSMITCMLICFWMLSGNSGISISESGRASISILGVTQDPNYISYLFFFCFAVAISGVFELKNIILKLISLAVALVVMYCVLMTGSRGAWLSCAAIIIVYILGKYRLSPQLIFGIIFLGIAVAYIFPFLLSLLSDGIASRFSIAQLLSDHGTGRLEIWISALKKVVESPIYFVIGHGIGSSNAVIGYATHNYMLQIMIEEGIIGLIIFLRFCIYWIKQFAIEKSIISLSVFIAALVMSLTLSVNTNYYFWVTLSTCIATKGLCGENSIWRSIGLRSK